MNEIDTALIPLHLPQIYLIRCDECGTSYTQQDKMIHWNVCEIRDCQKPQKVKPTKSYVCMYVCVVLSHRFEK